MHGSEGATPSPGFPLQLSTAALDKFCELAILVFIPVPDLRAMSESPKVALCAAFWLSGFIH